jgi:elongation factor G
MHANKQNPIDFIEADIGAAVGFKDIKTEIHWWWKHPIILSQWNSAPVIGIAIEPKTKADVDKWVWLWLN